MYDIYSSAIALLEELEKRETSRKGKPMLQTSDVKIPDQTEKDDEDVSKEKKTKFSESYVKSQFYFYIWNES